MCRTILFSLTVIACCHLVVLGKPQDFIESPDYFDEPIPATQKRQIQIQPPRQAPTQRFANQRPSQSEQHRFATAAPPAQRPPQIQGQFNCPESDGIYADDFQCDKYYKCEGFIPTEKLCDDGLVYDSRKGGANHADPCDSPYVVDCTDRPELQEPTFTSDYCPRRHGLFADPDPFVCNKYYTCIKGQHSVTSCATGLQFDENTGTCTWPYIAKRENCTKEKADTTVNGFTCPGNEVINDLGVKIPHPTYANLDDCAKFYVCLNGVKPQEASCNLGKVFNDNNGMCDYPEFVPECAQYYKDSDYYYDVDAVQG